MIRTRSGPKIPVEFFDNFILDIVIDIASRDERIELSCKSCEREVYSDCQSGTLSDFMLAAGDHECPKVVSPAEDSSMTNAEIQETRDVAVATGKFQVREKPQVSRGNPYASTQEVVEFVERVKTVNPKNNVL